jgi:uncharacterized protein (DUF362 family)
MSKQVRKTIGGKHRDLYKEIAFKSMKTSFMQKPISRRSFLKGTMAGLCFSMLYPLNSAREVSANPPNPLFWVRNIPNQPFYGGGNGNYHIGVDQLLRLMGEQGLKFYLSSVESDLGGPAGMIGPNDIVLIKVNAQWKYRGCTNSDLIRGLIQRILDHPDGFNGEVVIFENGQGRGSLNCDTRSNYPDALVHANANNESHSFIYLVDTVFNDARVSAYLLDPIRGTFIQQGNHVNDGYRIYENVSYPCITTTGGYRVELREGIWNGSGHTQNLKLINLPVLKHHDTGGSEITASLKHCYGILSMDDGQSGFRHYGGLGQTCGKMIVSVRTPVLNIIDAIWVSHSSLSGYPIDTTFRANQILASQDPVALDYWAAKYIMYPISQSPRHLPTFSGINLWLTDAQAMINGRGGLYDATSGIFVSQVTKNEEEMEVFAFSGITVLTPTGGEAIASGESYMVSWEAIPDAVSFKLMFSMDSGATWNEIARGVTEKSYSWNVPIPLTNKRKCLVKVIGFNSGGKKLVLGRTQSPFAIDVVRVTSPIRKEVLTSGITYTIAWQKNGTKNPVDKIRLSYSKDGGGSWYPITSLPGDAVSFDWPVPTVKAKKPNCKVRVILKDINEKTVGSDVSDGYFTIQLATLH